MLKKEVEPPQPPTFLLVYGQMFIYAALILACIKCGS